MTHDPFQEWSRIHSAFSENASGAWAPKVDVCENANTVMVRAEIAGVQPGAIEVHLTEQTLILSGIRKDPYCGETCEGFQFQQMEMYYGPFERIIPLPCSIEGEGATARCRNGILEIRLPKSASHRRQSVQISIQLSS